MQEYIDIRSARENNFNNVAFLIPKRKITIFTGISDSVKSSIVFDTTPIIFSPQSKYFATAVRESSFVN
jgi:excinuclease UvrABC ATPase subunit